MILPHWIISILNVLFVWMLGVITLWLFFQSLMAGRVRRPLPKQREELLIEVSKDGAPLLKFPLTKSHYLIGREPECEVLLRGAGVPLRLAEIRKKNGAYLLKNFKGDNLSLNGIPVQEQEVGISPGDAIGLSNYLIRVRERT